MKKVAFFYSDESSRSKYLIDILKHDYELIIVRNHDEIVELFNTSYDSLNAFIIDHPADKPDCANNLFKAINNRNSFMFTLPVLILTSHELIEEDDKFLCDLAVDIISEGESKSAVLQRIKNTIKFSNSASFDDFSTMLKSLPSLIYLKDTRGRYAFCSQNWHHLTNPNQSIRGLTDFDVRKDKKNAQIAQDSDRKVIESGKGTSYVIKESDNEGTDYLQIIKEPLKNEKGEVTGIIAIINNVTKEELLKQELKKKSITDQLTGLFNRVYFDELVSRFQSHHTVPLTIITADCDGLKKINDKYGHAAGDKYINMTKDVLKESLPPKSFLFRMGGDEFVAIIPGMKSYEGIKLVKDIIKNSKKYKTSQFQLKLSAGSYTISRRGISIETAMARSDKEMYKMKKKHKRGH